MTNQQPSQNPPLNAGLWRVVAATACWSTSGLFITFISAASDLSPLQIAFWRDLSTALALLIGLAIFNPGLLRVRRRDVPWLAAMGAISIGAFHALWNTSVLLNGVSVSTVFQSNSPLLVAIAAWFLWREPFTRQKLIAIALAFAGTVLISRLDQVGQARITPLGVALGIGVALAFSGMALLGKKLTGHYSQWTVLVYAFGFGSLALLPFQGWGFTPPWRLPAPVWGYLAGLVFLTSIGGFGLYTAGLKRLQAGVAVIASTTEVFFAAVVSYLALGERLDPWQILGALMVVGGVVVLAWPQKQARVEAVAIS